MASKVFLRILMYLSIAWFYLPLAMGQESHGHRIFSFELSSEDYKWLANSEGQKIDIKPISMELNGRPVAATKLHVRGKSSLYFHRKSFSIHLHKDTTINYKGDQKRLMKFYLLSLSMDQNFFHNRVAFHCLHELGLFPLFQEYAEVIINGETQGIYLAMEKPEEYVFKNFNGGFILRRGPNDQIDEYESGKKVSKETEKLYKKQYQAIAKICRKQEGEELMGNLSTLIDLEGYMTWLAFNFWVQNGDYNDEVFFYSSGKDQLTAFLVLPWDYDDIFVSGPHEGQRLRDRKIGEAQIFSSEDLIGRTIANDPVLYTRYEETLKKVLSTLLPGKLKMIFQETYDELIRFYDDPAILETSKYVQSGETNAEALKKDLWGKHRFMEKRRKEISQQSNNKQPKLR